MIPDEARPLLQDLRDEVSRATHDANNPLTVISGNAQLLVELVAALGVGEELAGPVRDIQEASDELEASLKQLNAVKARLTAALGSDAIG